MSFGFAKGEGLGTILLAVVLISALYSPVIRIINFQKFTNLLRLYLKNR